ncbi:MAG TPA: ADP-ribosylglycohydrolase family protein [Solirubrobacterales bacterium]|nr:ADP-ribosylglycohydrolase family protein [Solirubrobacterales bacterium]
MSESLRLTDSLDRARDPMLAAAIGDALGWPVENRSGRVGGISRVQPRLEFVDWMRREGGGYAPHQVEVAAGSYSDDTQLILAVARSRMRGSQWWRHWTDCELPLWLLYERGGGGATKRAAQAWNRGLPPWSEENKPSDLNRYWRAGGNGVAMRVLPHVLVGDPDAFGGIAAHIVADGICTHGHPRALIGALAHSYALWLALKQKGTLGFGELIERTLDEEDAWAPFPGAVPHLDDWTAQMEIARPPFADEWKQTRIEMRHLFESCRESLRGGSLAVDRKTLQALGAFDKSVNGAGTIAAAAAVFLASRYASRPAQGLMAAAFAKGADTDTIASMTGSLLGAIQQDGWLSGLKPRLQDASYIEQVASDLAQNRSVQGPIQPWRQENRKSFLRALAQADEGNGLSLPIFGRCRIRHRDLPETKSSSKIFEWIMATEAGQTLHVKRVVPTPKKRAATATQPDPSTATPFWIVLRVANLEASQRFYGELFGFPVRENGNSGRLFVLDRIVLERAAADAPPPPATEEDLLASRQSITLFMDTGALEQMHKKLVSLEAPVSGVIKREGRVAFRCADPDGNVVEVRAGAQLQRS